MRSLAGITKRGWERAVQSVPVQRPATQPMGAQMSIKQAERFSVGRPSGSDQDGLDRTEIHELLSNERRVRVLESLCEDREWEVSALAEEIAASETGRDPPPRNKRQSVYVTLDRTHLPKLDGLDIVDYDAQRKIVSLDSDGWERLTEAITETECVLSDSEPEKSPDGWIDSSIAVAVAGLATTGAARLELLPPGPVSAPTYAELALVALVAYLVYQKGRLGTEWFTSLRQRLG